MSTFHSSRQFPPLPFIPALGFSLLALAAPAVLHAATFTAGNVTTTLGPTFFLDNAANGGGDVDIVQPAAPSFIRPFVGLLTANQGPTRVTLTGFGFATHTNAAANNASSVAVTFTYLGADEASGGGDDVIIGTASGGFAFIDPASNPGAEYALAFDTPLVADLTITGTKFSIRITPSNATNNGSLKLKTTASGNTDAKLSVAGVTAPLITPQRVNLAKFQNVTASSVAGQRRASYVTDGVTGNDNRWQGSSSTWQSAVVDFPFPVEIGSAQVFTGVDATSPIASYGLQYWNGSTWVNIAGGSVTGNTDVERNLVFTSPVTASSFRFLSAEANLRLRELALYPPNGPAGFPLGTDLTLNLAYQRPTAASSSISGNHPLNAVDGRTNGFTWQTNTAGVNTFDIDLRVSTRIGSAHLYSGSTGIPPLGSFVMKYWDGTAWQNISGGTVSGNTAADRIIPFTPVTTSMVRLEFTNPGTTAIRELCIFPANTGNTGYPLGTNLISSGVIPDYETYNDAFQLINHPVSGRNMSVPTSGQPALDPPGLSFGQNHYQILLNLSTGTYRIRNRATGNCLSGAQLSKAPGLPLTDSPYAAMPHQDWILDPLGGGEFRLINTWSGLAVDTQGGATAQGTALVQNTAGSATTQRWEFAFHAWNTKKGIGGTTFAAATRPAWAYNWGRTNSSPTPQETAFFPMQWGSFSWDINSTQGPLWQDYPAWRRQAGGIHLLGFNEPDAWSQSGSSLDPGDTGESDFSLTRSVNEAVRLWPRLLSMDLPLVSPAPASTANGWFSSFNTQAASLGYRVDYTAIHTYPGPSGGSSDNLINSVQSAHDTWNRPVWLTEFSFVDWGKNQTWSEEDNYNCLAEFLWRAESNDKLRKYALFIFTEDDEWPQPANPWSAVSPAPRSNSYDRNGNPTAFGKLYAAWDGEATVKTAKTYMLHHKGLRKRMANAATTNTAPGGRTIRTDGQIVNWTLVSTGVSNRYHVVSSIDGRRLGYVAGAANPNNDPTLAAPGTTGVDVEWSLTHQQHGWYYLGHPQTNTRLKLVSFNTSNNVADYQMVAASATDDSVQWRFIVAPQEAAWTGGAGTFWATAGNWSTGAVPSDGQRAAFTVSSTANHATVLNQDITIDGLRVANPTAAVTISGTHSLTLGAYGIDLASATRDLTINTPVILGSQQGWSVGTSRTLTLGGPVSGNHELSISGAGRVLLGASNLLPNSAGNGNLMVNGTLDLNGNPQSVNGLSGTGIIDNTSAAAVSLTVGNNNATATGCVFQDTGGSLTLIKNGSGSLTLPNASTHSGGLTNHGTGSIIPQNNAAFGSGPVVMNGGTVYSTSADHTLANPLSLNGASLRVGGGNNRVLTWTGPVTATGNSIMTADGGTTGVVISGGLEISGATFSSSNSSAANTISGVVSGTSGTLNVTAGTLNLNAANTFSGNLRAAQGSLVIGNPLAMQNATLDMNAADSGSVNLNHLNATLGALTGSRNLSLGNGTVSIGNNHSYTTYGGVLSGNGSLVKTGNGTLTLTAANLYAGTTTIAAGSLALGANNVLPATAVIIGSAALDAATFSDTTGTLDVTGSATIRLGSGAALAFAASSGVSWTGGTLEITGPFVPGSSIRFGTSAAALTATQLGLISVPGIPALTLTPAGYLTAAPSSPYDLWKTQITNGLNARTDDADGDGFTNLHEFLFGTSPVAGDGSLVRITPGANSIVLRWLQRETAATYTLEQSTDLAPGSWTGVPSPLPAPDADQSGTPANYDRHTVTLPTTGGQRFFRVKGTEN